MLFKGKFSSTQREKIKSLRNALDFVGLKDYLEQNDLYSSINQQALIAETLAFGAYSDAQVLMEENKIPQEAYWNIAYFADEDTFCQAMECLEDFQQPDLAMLVIKCGGLDLDKKIYHIIRLHALNDSIIDELVEHGSPEMLEAAVGILHLWSFEVQNSNLLRKIQNKVIAGKNLEKFEMVIKKSFLQPEQLSRLTDDDFKVLLKNNNDYAGVVIKMNNLHLFGIVLEEVEDLSERQLRELFEGGNVELFRMYVKKHKLPKLYETKLVAGEYSPEFLKEYSLYQKVNWKIRLRNFFMS